MNRLKSIFVILFAGGTGVLASLSVQQLFTQGFSISRLGALLATLPAGLFFAMLYLYRTPRTRASMPVATTAVFLGILLTVIGHLGQPDLVSLSFAIVMLIAWPLYLFWYSRLGRPNNRQLKVGEQLPDFALESAQGETVRSSSFLGKPNIFLFYRGNWCPLCMAQIREVAAHYQTLNKHGVNIILISPQSHKNTEKLARQFNVQMTFLVDPENRAARQLQIAHQNGTPILFLTGYASETVFPTVIITDAKGKIIFADLTDNYRVRPTPDTFLRILNVQPA